LIKEFEAPHTITITITITNTIIITIIITILHRVG
jgi:hypothetical protein